jgi:hypothetical protein
MDLDRERTTMVRRAAVGGRRTGLVERETSRTRSPPDAASPEENCLRRFAPPWQQDIRRRHVPDYGDWLWWWRARHVQNSAERRMLAAYLRDT